MRIPTKQTVDRRAEKAKWLRANPKHHGWLLDNAELPIHVMSKKPEAVVLCRLLREAGIYSQTTVTVDICASMRRTARSVELGSIAPTEQAKAEVFEILTRPGVKAGEVLRVFAHTKSSKAS